MTMDGDSSSLVPKAVRAIVCGGVDLAKNVFAIHGVDDVGEAVWAQARVPRARLLVAFSHPPWRFIGLATCSGALLRARHATA